LHCRARRDTCTYQHTDCYRDAATNKHAIANQHGDSDDYVNTKTNKHSNGYGYSDCNAFATGY
jgi:hypothetical protein